MLTLRRLATWSLTIALSSVPVLLSDGVAPSLSLSPGSGPPGSSVSAGARGYGDCPTNGNDDVGPGTVAFYWGDADHLASVPVLDDGTAALTFVVPESATIGAHEVHSVCEANPKLQATQRLAVTPPVERPTIVPDLFGLSLDEAKEALREARLVIGRAVGTGPLVQSQRPEAGTDADPGTSVQVNLGSTEPARVVVPNIIGRTVADATALLVSSDLERGSVSGSGGIVRNQHPGSGTRVRRGRAVDITVGQPAPVLTVVPRLVGRKLRRVPAVLLSRGLVLGPVTGGKGVVRSQRPAAGRRVPRDSTVTVSVDARPPVRLVRVPNLVGTTADEARATLGTARLLLGNTPDGDVVDSQAPVAGTLVPLGSPVTVVMSAEPTPWWPAAAVLAGLSGATVLGQRSIRARRQRSWVRSRVRVVPRGTRTAGSKARETADDPSSERVVLRLDAHADPGTHVLQEVDR